MTTALVTEVNDKDVNAYYLFQGYCFENKSATRASYYHAMNLMGKINELGCDMTIQSWLR